MVSPGLNGPIDCDPRLSDGSETALSDYLETIEILQEEVARLEQELLARDARLQEIATAATPAREEAAPSADSGEAATLHAQELDGLQHELAERDQTIGLLLDELDRVEAAQRANRAEWEQLTGWISELEHRVEGQDGEAMARLESRLTTAQQKAAVLERKAEQDRRAWESQRQIYQNELSELQAALDQVTAAESASARSDESAASAPDLGVVEALRAENLRIRAAWQELVERSAAAESTESLEARLAACQEELERARRQLKQSEDARRREHLEHQATLAEMQTRIPQTPPASSQEIQAEKKPEGAPRERDLDLRMRALRQHLQEIEERERTEREERRQKNLIVRLSKLWSRTGPH